MSKELSNIIEKASSECLLMMKVRWSEIALLNDDKQEVNNEIAKLDAKIRKIAAEKKELNKQVSEINSQIKQINSDVIIEIERTANRHSISHSTLKSILHHDSRFNIPLPKRLIGKFSDTD